MRPPEAPAPCRFFVTAAAGTEGALRDELRELGLRSVRADRGGVHFAGQLWEGYRACLHSRIGVRVLWLQGEFDARGGEALYEGVRSMAWHEHLTPEKTLAVTAHVKSSALTHSQFVAQRTKDGVVDPLRQRFNARPSVDLRDPDVHLFVHLVKDRASVYLDLAGDPLHRRGYRAGLTHEAPLKENLAAAVLRLAGWDRALPLLDPLCGTGTFAVEAALWSRCVAPGLARPRFGFERWASYDPALRKRWEAMREEAKAQALSTGPTIEARDVDPACVETTLAAARAAGVTVLATQADVRDLERPAERTFVLCNPPYGERLEADGRFYRDFARAFARLEGYPRAVLSGSALLERALPRATSAQLLRNGPLECRLLRYAE